MSRPQKILLYIKSIIEKKRKHVNKYCFNFKKCNAKQFHVYLSVLIKLEKICTTYECHRHSYRRSKQAFPIYLMQHIQKLLYNGDCGKFIQIFHISG